MRFGAQQVNVKNGFQFGKLLAPVRAGNIAEIGVGSVVADGVHAIMTGKEDGALIVKFLRDHGELAEAKNVASADDGIERAKSGTVTINPI
jgi:hypothetical protein